MHSAGAIDQLPTWVGKLVACDEREQGDGLAGASGHFQEAVTFSIEGTLKLEHVLMLFWVDEFVREVDSEAFDIELHGDDGDFADRESNKIGKQKSLDLHMITDASDREPNKPGK